jgi:hypothetical protein
VICVSPKKQGRKCLKFQESNENKITTYQNFWDTEKAMLRENFIDMSANIFKNH